jgi:YcxB-like protein
MNNLRFRLTWRDYFEAERYLLRQQKILSVPLIRRLRLKRRWEREPLLRAEHLVNFNAEGIHYLLDEIESNLDWNYYQSWAESPEGFLLISAEDVFNFIPKRAFLDETKQTEFRKFLKAKLPQQ